MIAYVSPHAPEVARAAHAARRAGLRGAGKLHRRAAGHAAPGSAARQPRQRPAPPLDPAPHWRRSPSGSLDEAQAKQLFARFGVPCAREVVVDDAAEAEQAARALGGAVVLKILSGEITHKSDVGGVAVNLAPEQVGARLIAMAAEVEAKTGVRPERFLVQEMVRGGIELILGMHRDPLGTAILLGMGGVTAELFEGHDHGRLLPGEAASAATKRSRWCGAQDLAAARRLPRPAEGRREALVDAIVAFSQMAAQLGERLVEAEINPVFVLPQGQGVRAADGVVVLN